MFNLLKNYIKIPLWAENDSRYKRLAILDALLDGTFYDNLPYDFEEETSFDGSYIPIQRRRPNVQFNLPRSVSKRCARKLFAGRQSPHFVHSDKDLIHSLVSLMHEGFFNSKILQAVVWGSVGSVAITFRIIKGGEGIPRIVFDTWRARWCIPMFDALGELKSLRVQYPCAGQNLIATIATKDYEGQDVRTDRTYWFIRDYTTTQEIQYKPILEDDYSPSEPDDQKKLKPIDEQTFSHNYGFVPGHWFVNLAGGDAPDGACTWEPAISIGLHMDYTMSQAGRGLWYNSAPQLVVQGKLVNINNDPETNQIVIRGPVTWLQFAATVKNANGDMIQGGDARLLEMTGTGLTVTINFIEMLRKYAFEVIQMSRKDPDKMGSAPLSGRAMEILEDDFVDMIQELRTMYGEMGVIPLIKKAARAAKQMGHPLFKGRNLSNLDELKQQWPKPFPVDSQELYQIAQAIVTLMYPTSSLTPPKPGPASVGGGKPAPAPAPLPRETDQLLTPKEARALLETLIDIPQEESTIISLQQEPLQTDELPGTAPSPEVPTE